VPAPEPIDEPDLSQEPVPAAREGRDAGGRFTKGNKGGPGNPFARQVAALRKALVEKVTPEDMEAIATSLILRARGGNLPAIKLLFSYVIGTPTPAVNPDTLDHEEMQQYGREVGMEELLCRVGRALTPEIACDLVRTVRPVNMSRICNALADQLLEGVPPEYLPPNSDAEGDTDPDLTPPSANGDIGAAEDVEDERGEGPAAEGEPADDGPLTNGDNRGGESVAAPSPRPAGNGSKCHRKTGRVNPSAPGPQWPPHAGDRREAPPPEAQGKERRPAPGDRRSAKPEGSPPWA
jgi:hypothetical protein